MMNDVFFYLICSYLDLGLHLVVHLLGDLWVPPLHVRALLRVERVRDRAEDEHISLDATLALLLLPLLLSLFSIVSIKTIL